MRSIVGASMKFQSLMTTVAIALMALGVTKRRGMPVDLLPEFSSLYVKIQAEALGLYSVLMYFGPGTGLFRARQMAERISQSAVDKENT